MDTRKHFELSDAEGPFLVWIGLQFESTKDSLKTLALDYIEWSLFISLLTHLSDGYSYLRHEQGF